MNIDKVIEIVRNNKLTEEMVAGADGFTGSADPKGPVAGFDPVMKGPIRRKTCLGKGKMPGCRKRWKEGIA